MSNKKAQTYTNIKQNKHIFCTFHKKTPISCTSTREKKRATITLRVSAGKNVMLRSSVPKCERRRH